MSYYEDGQLFSEGSYENGKMIGLWTYYTKDGNISSQGHRNGYDKEGLWYVSKNIFNFSDSTFYENGKMHGRSVEYDTLGQLRKECSYENGLLTWWISFLL